jgi:uncharacterized protein YdeI (YjbR/CyaY-like superfamily)
MAKKSHQAAIELVEVTSPDGKPVIAFASPKQFANWLHKYHSENKGVWIQFFKVASGCPSITYAQALDVALCYGWIDGPVRKGNDACWIHKFTPRGKRRVWSQVNRQNIERLTREGLMQPAGLAAVELAKADGRWDAAYASSSTFEESTEFLAALTKSKKATEFYATLTRAKRYAFYHKLHNVKKEETKRKKISEFISMLERGETFH